MVKKNKQTKFDKDLEEWIEYLSSTSEERKARRIKENRGEPKARRHGSK